MRHTLRPLHKTELGGLEWTQCVLTDASSVNQPCFEAAIAFCAVMRTSDASVRPICSFSYCVYGIYIIVLNRSILSAKN